MLIKVRREIDLRSSANATTIHGNRASSQRLISKIHHTTDCRQCCHVANTAQHCKLGLFQVSDFAGALEDSKSTSGVSCVFLEVELSSSQLDV